MFKETFKYYKSKWPPPDLGKVLDFDIPSDEDVSEVKPVISEDVETPLGLIPVSQWKCYELKNRPGLIFISNPFTSLAQRYWLARCLQDYPKRPNVVNLSPKMFKQNVIDDWWSSLQHSKDKSEQQKLKNSMRWTTLGYHHDWDTKVYSESMKHTFPEDLRYLTGFFAKVLGYQNYSAEAAIVNYYPIGTTLSGHTDHSEADLHAPLFSLSFGQTAIFLIGGQTKEEEPTALFLKSGDVVVMSKESRLCYHAVPKIMKTTKEPWNQLTASEITNDYDGPPETKKRKENISSSAHHMSSEILEKCSNERFWSCFSEYLQDSRVNINVRQVLKEGQETL